MPTFGKWRDISEAPKDGDMMDDEEYQNALKALRDAWGGLVIDGAQPGILRAANDPTMGLIVGMRAKLIAEIINRALDPLHVPTRAA